MSQNQRKSLYITNMVNDHINLIVSMIISRIHLEAKKHAN